MRMPRPAVDATSKLVVGVALFGVAVATAVTGVLLMAVDEKYRDQKEKDESDGDKSA